MRKNVISINSFTGRDRANGGKGQGRRLGHRHIEADQTLKTLGPAPMGRDRHRCNRVNDNKVRYFNMFLHCGDSLTSAYAGSPSDQGRE